MNPKSDYHNSLERVKERRKNCIPLHVLYTALFRKNEAEEIEMREALIKGLIPEKTEKRLTQLLNIKARQQFIEKVAKTAWDTFYEQV